MKIPNVSLRAKTYWWKKRVPKQLDAVFVAQGYPSGHIFQKSLATHDPAVALVRAAAWDDWLKNGGDAVSTKNNTRAEMYDKLRAEYEATTPDERYGIRPPLLNPDLVDAISQGDLHPDDLSPQDRAAFFVQRDLEQGKGRPTEYMYSLRDCLKDYRAQKAEDVTPKTLNAFDRAVTLFLADRDDLTLNLIKSASVALWIDGLTRTTAHGTRQDHVNRLKALFNFAQSRGHVDPDRKNPFESHDLGKRDKKPYSMMTDEQLLQILAELKRPVDQLPPIIARHTGMRLGEIFNASLETIEGVLCFVVKELADGEWSPKTKAGIRNVPVRDSIKHLVDAEFHNLKTAKGYSKKFTAVKQQLFPNTNRELVFHSLRKTFVTFAQRSGYSSEQVAWLVGHEDGKGNAMTGRLYMQGLTVTLLKEIIESTPPLEGF